MLNVVTMPIRELTALVELGAAETGLPEAIVEKGPLGLLRARLSLSS